MYGRYFGAGANLPIPAGYSSKLAPESAARRRRELNGIGSGEGLEGAVQQPDLERRLDLAV